MRNDIYVFLLKNVNIIYTELALLNSAHHLLPPIYLTANKTQ